MPKSEEGFNIEHTLWVHGIQPTSPGVLEPLSDWDLGLDALSFEAMDSLMEPLPIDDFKDKIVDTVLDVDNPVTIITAETGAGKSTRVPLMLLDLFDTVYHTQPRRLAAHEVNKRVRDEVSEIRYTRGFGGDEIVSCQTAASLEGPPDARIRIVTDGLQLVRELNGKVDHKNTVLIVDEVHELNNNIEVLLAWSKFQIKQGSGLKVVLLSATMDDQRLVDYFSRDTNLEPKVLKVPGRNHKIEKFVKPKSTMLKENLKLISQILEPDTHQPLEPGAILNFLPGVGEITDLAQRLHNQIPEHLLDKVLILPLHAKQSQEEHQKAMTVYPEGIIKVILATNVASTSITVPDVKYVIDGGYVRRIELDNEGVSGLMKVPSSLAELSQNAGRTGRVSDGVVIQACLDDEPFVHNEGRSEYPVPAILSSQLDKNQLQLKAVNLDLSNFDMYNQPSDMQIELANINLRLLGAIDAENNLTEVGEQMNQYPLGAAMARVMVEATRYNENVRRYLAAITASNEAGDLRYYLPNSQTRWQELIQDTSSDHMAQLDLFITSQIMTKSQMVDHDLDINTIVRAREQFVKVAKIAKVEPGFMTPPTVSEQEDIKACLVAGYLPYIYRQQGEGYVHAFRPNMSSERVLSNRSVVTTLPEMLMGRPYNVQLKNGEIKRQIDDVLPVSAMLLGQVAAAQTVWVSSGFENQGSEVHERQHLRLFGLLDLGIEKIVKPEPSPVLRETIVQLALTNPGYAQLKLRETKKTLEELVKYSKDPVPRISSVFYEQLIREAAPAEVTNLFEVEDNLWAIINDPQRKLGLDDFVPVERRQKIINDAVPTLEAEGVTLKLGYLRGRPIAQHYRATDILALTSEVFLPDGRQVFFARPNDRKKYTLFQLQHILGKQL